MISLICYLVPYNEKNSVDKYYIVYPTYLNKTITINGILHKSMAQKYRKAEYVQRRVCFVNGQSYLYDNVFFSVCALMCNAAYVMFIIWNSISGLDA